MEGLSGSRFNDVLTGSNDVAAERAPARPGRHGRASAAARSTQQGIALHRGPAGGARSAGVTSFAAGDIILGGDGSDMIMGHAGDDIIDGDKWLDVQIGVCGDRRRRTRQPRSHRTTA